MFLYPFLFFPAAFRPAVLRCWCFRKIYCTFQLFVQGKGGKTVLEREKRLSAVYSPPPPLLSLYLPGCQGMRRLLRFSKAYS